MHIAKSLPCPKNAPESFLSLAPLTTAIVNCKKNTSKEKVKWFKIHWIRITKDRPLEFRYRFTTNSLKPWKIVIV